MIKKREFIWNTIGSLISSVLNAIILAFCTRLNGIEIAGMFSISYATASILDSVGNFGLRIYQTTDTERKNTFSEYLIARLFAVTIMVMVGIIFVIVTGYTEEKLYICILLILFRAIENISETYQAEFQLNGRLELGGKTIIYRNIIGLIVFFILDYITRNIILSLIGFLITNIIIFAVYDARLIKKFTKISFKVNKENVIKVIKECIPLAVSTLISMYVINAVKYAIDKSGDYTMQTYFNILYMPTFIINMLSIFIIKPFLKPFGEYWNEKKYKKFIKIILAIVGILALATICAEIGAYIVGIPILNLLYGVDLGDYKIHLMLLIFSGFLYACTNVLFNALGTMRAQKLTTIAYTVVSIFALFVPEKLVELYGMTGASISCIIIMNLLFICMVTFFIHVYISNMKAK